MIEAERHRHDRIGQLKTSADCSAAAHFIVAPRVKPAGCAGGAGQQEARDERVSVWARCILRVGEQRTAYDSSPRPLATRMPRTSCDLLARGALAICAFAQVRYPTLPDPTPNVRETYCKQPLSNALGDSLV